MPIQTVWITGASAGIGEVFEDIAGGMGLV